MKSSKNERKSSPLFSVTSKDCKFDYYVGSGDGGQKKQKTASAVRCTHKESGAVGKAEDTRSQLKNKQLAFGRMAETKKFQEWLRVESLKALGIQKQIEDKVEREIKKVKVEVQKEGRWVEYVGDSE